MTKQILTIRTFTNSTKIVIRFSNVFSLNLNETAEASFH
jgi:hypothetical protein